MAQLKIKVGETVGPGASSVILADLSIWQIKTDDLTEIKVPTIKAGQPVTIKADALPDVTLKGEIVTIGLQSQERNGDMQKVLLVLGLIAGLLLAYVDSRPNWDDTGITVFALLLSSGLLGLAGFRRPWLLGLVVGIWIPLWEGISRTNFGALAALIFAFAGAYAGWAAHKLLRKLLRPA